MIPLPLVNSAGQEKLGISQRSWRDVQLKVTELLTGTLMLPRLPFPGSYQRIVWPASKQSIGTDLNLSNLQMGNVEGVQSCSQSILCVQKEIV